LVERKLPKLEVAGSNPVVRFEPCCRLRFEGETAGGIGGNSIPIGGISWRLVDGAGIADCQPALLAETHI
jgi:hypothetical protein